MTTTAADLLQGQIEALVPQLLAAKGAREAAAAHEQALKDQLAELIGSPQTVETVWGKVILHHGRTTFDYDKLTKAKISVLQETAIEQGKAKQKVGKPYISVIES